MKLIASITLIVIAFGVGIFFFWPDPASTGKQSNTDVGTDLQRGGNELIIGDPNAGATIIEYGGFKCPSCGQFHQTTGKQIRAEYVDTGLAKIIFRPYPIYAVDGAQALIGAYCAKDQKKFTEYHDAVFDYMWVNHYRQGDEAKAIENILTRDVMNGIMKNIGMDTDAYWKCKADKIHEDDYENDLLKSGPDEVQGTPTFIVGGQKIVGPQPFSVFKTLLDIHNESF